MNCKVDNTLFLSTTKRLTKKKCSARKRKMNYMGQLRWCVSTILVKKKWNYVEQIVQVINNTSILYAYLWNPDISINNYTNNHFKQSFFANNQSISEEYSSVKYDQDNALEWEK